MKITFDGCVKRLGATSRRVLTEVAESLGIDEVVVTSTIRPPRRQAETMLTNIENNRHIRYAWAGRQVCDLARSMRGENAERKQILDAMEQKIIQLAESGYRVSKHCVSEAQYDRLNVVDVSYRRIADSKRIDFVKKMSSRVEVSKTLQPLSRSVVGYDAAEPALHFEIKQT